MRYSFLIAFSIFFFFALNLQAQSNEVEIFTIVENMPEYPGGQDAMYGYLAENLKYPEKAKKKGIEGIVFVTFVVLETGEISETKVLRGIGGGCDEVAVDVIDNMPFWKPGIQRGKKVRVQYNLPIRFKL